MNPNDVSKANIFEILHDACGFVQNDGVSYYSISMELGPPQRAKAALKFAVISHPLASLPKKLV
jgi:hypothetical protein